jgi:hypothetical protein
MKLPDRTDVDQKTKAVWEKFQALGINLVKNTELYLAVEDYVTAKAGHLLKLISGTKAYSPIMYECLQELKEWLETGKVDGVGFDDATVLDRVKEVLAKIDRQSDAPGDVPELVVEYHFDNGDKVSNPGSDFGQVKYVVPLWKGFSVFDAAGKPAMVVIRPLKKGEEF